MPLILVALLAAGVTFWWLDRRRDLRQPAQLPPGGGGAAPAATILTASEVQEFVQRGSAEQDPRLPLLLAEALKQSGSSTEAAALRRHALSLVGIPSTTPGFEQAQMELGNLPLDVVYTTIIGMATKTPDSLNRAAYFARSNNQQGLANFIQTQNSAPSTSSFDFAALEIINLANQATTSTDPSVKLAIADTLDRYSQYGGPAAADALRSAVLAAIPKTAPVASDPQWLGMLRTLPLSYQNLVLIGLGLGTPESITRSANMVSAFGINPQLVLGRI